jgi:hypothetical protein
MSSCWCLPWLSHISCPIFLSLDLTCWNHTIWNKDWSEKKIAIGFSSFQGFLSLQTRVEWKFSLFMKWIMKVNLINCYHCDAFAVLLQQQWWCLFNSLFLPSGVCNNISQVCLSVQICKKLTFRPPPPPAPPKALLLVSYHTFDFQYIQDKEHKSCII